MLVANIVTRILG